MNIVKQFYFVTVAYAGLACAAAFESPSSCMVQMKKNNSVSACVLNKPVYSLSDVSGVAMLDHIADAAGIDLNDQPNDILSRLVYETVGNSLKSEIATADEATIACEIVPFIKRCRQTYDALSLDQRRCSLLGECDGQACPATRSTKPAVRSTFEGMVLDATTARYVETYCAFAPGGLLQDLRLLEQFKAQGKTVRTIVLIDISYGPVCQVMNLSWDMNRRIS